MPPPRAPALTWPHALFDRVGNYDYVAAHYGLYLGTGNVDPAVIAEEIVGPYNGPEPFAQE